MILFKNNISINEVKPELILGLLSVYSVYKDYGYDCTITSITDSIHSPNSLHYTGHACDFRIYHIPNNLITFLVDDIRRCISPLFDVILEKDHIHIEYQPKTKDNNHVS